MLASTRILGGILAVVWGLAAIAEEDLAEMATPGALAGEAAPVELAADPAVLGPIPRPLSRPGAPVVLHLYPAPVRPRARDPYLPAAQWNDRPEGPLWTRTMISALEGHGHEVIETVPDDISEWCPAYAGNDADERAAFWVGLMSGVSHYESRHIPDVVGAGLYYGLLQIYPGTADAVDCRADSGSELRSAVPNLSCAVRIMSVVVPDHQAVGLRRGGWQGIANQWGPMTRNFAREAIRDYTRSQDYCQVGMIRSAPRPPARPYDLVRTAGPDDASRGPG
ncbi:lytic transglycosylase domain-containing protein [Wenxinia marina]|uniref:Transglycosylase SLT domain protein n=1 Tax=Wenxinia marina DSM 24838 TaxID=1123501 RepID=A0A0D0PAR7_9RHOB|nr:lytic transglycosylase domain-containing protein [Wenxinia marina]KIQ68566.1 hypothetical protein Wenmar_02837 [Wenxinia marina DSM 24838]